MATVELLLWSFEFLGQSFWKFGLCSISFEMFSARFGYLAVPAAFILTTMIDVHVIISRLLEYVRVILTCKWHCFAWVIVQCSMCISRLLEQVGLKSGDLFLKCANSYLSLTFAEESWIQITNYTNHQPIIRRSPVDHQLIIDRSPVVRQEIPSDPH